MISVSASPLKDLGIGRSEIYNRVYDKIIFCNGGDRTSGANTPEHELCEKIGVESVYGLGDKIQSSSWLTQDEKITRLKPEDLPEDTRIQRVVKEHILSLKK